MQIIEGKRFDEERALYGCKGVTVRKCAFDGPADGESAFKECSNIAAEDCFFNLRYPFRHDHRLSVTRSEMTELCRTGTITAPAVGEIIMDDPKAQGTVVVSGAKESVCA